MQPVKLRLLGDFWDSQLYGSELTLFTDSGSLRRIDWRAAIDAIADNEGDVRTAVRVAFIDGDLFYNPKVQKILRDPAVTAIIKNQLSKLASADLELPTAHGANCDSPFDFIPVDTDMYYSTLIACGDDGVFTIPRGDLGKSNPKNRVQKHHDARFLQVKASHRHTALASAAGKDGLIEFRFNPYGERSMLGRARVLAERTCSACEWSFQSVMGWSYEAAYVAKFYEQKQPNSNRRLRRFDRLYDVNELFEGGSDNVAARPAYTWGAREKFYRLSESGLQVGELANTSKTDKENLNVSDFKVRETTDFAYARDDVASTSIAPFGTVIELSDRIVVLRSDGLINEFPGEAVHWRIFPRSSHYSNQLHIIYDGYMDIVSFVHDYFVDQSEKLYGFAKSSATTRDEELADLW